MVTECEREILYEGWWILERGGVRESTVGVKRGDINEIREERPTERRRGSKG